MRSSEIVRSNRPLQVHPTRRMQRGYNSARPNQRRRPGRVQRVDKTGEAFIGSGNRVSRKRDAPARECADTAHTRKQVTCRAAPAGRSASPSGCASADGAKSGRHGPMHRTTVLLPIQRRADGSSAPVSLLRPAVSLPRPAPRVRPTPALTRLPNVARLPITRLPKRTAHERWRRRGSVPTGTLRGGREARSPAHDRFPTACPSRWRAPPHVPRLPSSTHTPERSMSGRGT